jgi:hypothetical protein
MPLDGHLHTMPSPLADLPRVLIHGETLRGDGD